MIVSLYVSIYNGCAQIWLTMLAIGDLRILAPGCSAHVRLLACIHFVIDNSTKYFMFKNLTITKNRLGRYQAIT